jgi:hypothetical protein
MPAKSIPGPETIGRVSKDRLVITVAFAALAEEMEIRSR